MVGSKIFKNLFISIKLIIKYLLLLLLFTWYEKNPYNTFCLITFLLVFGQFKHQSIEFFL